MVYEREYIIQRENLQNSPVSFYGILFQDLNVINNIILI